MSRLAFLVIINDASPSDDPMWLADEIQATVEDLGYRHVDVEVRTNTHCE